MRAGRGAGSPGRSCCGVQDQEDGWRLGQCWWSQQGFLSGWNRCGRMVRDDSGLSGLGLWKDRGAINLDGECGEGAGLEGSQKLSLGCMKFETLLRPP